METQPCLTLPFAARAAGLVGSVIDSSTSLLHKQTHDVVRFAMGSPATEAVPSEILADIAAARLSSADAYDYAATEGDPPLHTALLEMLRGTSDETSADRLTITAGGHAGARPVLQDLRRPGRPRRGRIPDLHERQRDGTVLRSHLDGDSGRRRRPRCRRAGGAGRRRGPHTQGDLHDPHLPEPVRRHAVAGAQAPAAGAGQGLGFDGDRRRPLRSAAIRGRAVVDAA